MAIYGIFGGLVPWSDFPSVQWRSRGQVCLFPRLHVSAGASGLSRALRQIRETLKNKPIQDGGDADAPYICL